MPMNDYSMDFLRLHMVSELHDHGIDNSAILEAFKSVRREYFMMDDFLFHAYDDEMIPIGHKQYLNDPLTEASLLSMLQIKKEDNVLEIGSGSGYLCALLSHLANEVYGVELLDPLFQKSSLLMKYFGYKNVSIVHGNGAHGYLEVAPFDKIIISFSMKDLPFKIVEQLAPNGKVLVPLDDGNETVWTLFTLSEDSLKMRKIMPGNVKAMIEE